MRSLLPILGVMLLVWPLQAQTAPAPLAIGHGEVALGGPWAFHAGDDPAFADPRLDDTGWERISLAAPAGAHDPDVGLEGYLPGWMERGHPGHQGYGWYRLRVRWTKPPGVDLVLLGPTLVDDAYEVYWNGRRIGGSTAFGASPPRTAAVRPTLLKLPETAETGEAVVAMRVFMTPKVRRNGDAGGIHVAPILAEAHVGMARHQAQWSKTFWGYVADAVEPALFLALAAFALFTRAAAPGDSFPPPLAGAVTAIAVLRLNQVLFFWAAIGDLPTFVLLKAVLLAPLGLLLVVLAWNRWGPPSRAIDRAALGLAALLALGGVVGERWPLAVQAPRLGLAALFLVLAWRLARKGADRLGVLPALALVATGQFAQELSILGVIGIWFPFGVGVSRTQYAYAALIPLLALLLARRALRRLRATAPEPRQGDAACAAAT